jgi:predicted acyltransferase
MGKTKRFVALDVLRGFTVALMIIVNNPGSWGHIYAPLEHSKWNGCTPTDLVFPFFLFAVGTAMWFAFKKFNHNLTGDATKKVLIRTMLIFLIGLGLNAFPIFGIDYSHLRIMGVLQRIALAYGIASLIALAGKRTGVWIALPVLLLGYWALLMLGGDGALTLDGNVVRTVDLSVFGPSHMYHGYGIPFDPEGLLSTLPAIGTVLIGYLVGRQVDVRTDPSRAVKDLILAGAAMTFAGVSWSFLLPLNKPLWSSSYVLYTAGLATLLLAFFIWIIDIRGYKKWSMPALVFGMNPLFIFVLSGIVGRLLYLIKFPAGGETVTLKGWVYQHLYASWAGNLNGSLFFALTLIFVYWILADILYRKKIFIKI